MEHAAFTPAFGQFLRRNRPLGLHGSYSSIFAFCSPGGLSAVSLKNAACASSRLPGAHSRPRLSLKEAVDTLRHAPEYWQTTLLIELAGENLINCFELADPNNGINAGRLAWAARNLLELHYFTRYVIDRKRKPNGSEKACSLTTGRCSTARRRLPP